MKIRIIRSKFLDGLKKVQNIVPSKGSLQIIQNVLLEAKDNKLYMTTTDLDIAIKSVVPCESVEPGATTLPVKLLAATVAKAQEGIIEIDVNENERASVSAGSAFFRIQGMNVIDYPKLPTMGNTFVYRIAQLTLREMLRKTAYAASQDETRKTLKGVLMSFRDSKLTMVATDGRRLALVEHPIECPAEAEQDIVLPTKVVSELQRSLGNDGDVQITTENKQVNFTIGDTVIWSKLLTDVYPNYRLVIPTEFKEHVAIERKPLLDALDRVSVMMMDAASSVKIIFDSNELIICSNTSENGDAKDTVPIKYAGPKIEISFNPGYVMDPLKAIDDDEITFDLIDGTRAAVLKCSVPFLYVMMPLRVN